MILKNNFSLKYTDTWSPRFRMLICFIYFLTLLFFGYLILISLEVKNVNNLKKQLSVAEKKYLSLVKRRIYLDSYHKQVIHLIKKYDVVMALMPDEKRASAFIQDVYNAARKRDVLVNRMKPGKVIVGPISNHLPIDIDVSGDYFSVAGFLSDLANYNHIISFDDLRFTKESSTNSGDQGKVKLSFELVTYYVNKNKVKSINDIDINDKAWEKKQKNIEQPKTHLKNLKLKR